MNQLKNAALADAQPPQDAPEWAYNAARTLGGENLIFVRAHIIYGAFLRRALPDPALTPPKNPQASPRTDRIVREQFAGHPGWKNHPLADFARTLETELAASAREVERLKEELSKWKDAAYKNAGYADDATASRDDLRADNAKLRAELSTAREALQPLVRQGPEIHGPDKEQCEIWVSFGELRRAIRAALHPQPGAKG